jgi:hypothetical protein
MEAADETNTTVEAVIAMHEEALRSHHNDHHTQQHTEFRDVYAELRAAGNWQLRAAKRYNRATVVMQMHWLPDGDGKLSDEMMRESHEAQTDWYEACSLVSRLIHELKLRPLA